MRKRAPGLSTRLVKKLEKNEIWTTLMIRDNNTFCVDIDEVYVDDDTYVVKIAEHPPTNQCVVFCYPTKNSGKVVIGRVDKLNIHANSKPHTLQCDLNKWIPDNGEPFADRV